jgi:two-component system, chemotaxis family, protein-glutamate methylesterase/glutaminase
MIRSNHYKAVVIGGSAGSFPVITKLLNDLRNDFPLPIVLCLHRLKHIREGFDEVLNMKSRIHVMEPEDKTKLRAGHIYLAPANYHLLIDNTHNVSLNIDAPVMFSRPSIDVLFESAANIFKDKLVGIILSGANSDGAHGMKLVKHFGGLTIVQDPNEASIKAMPLAAMDSCKIDYVYKADQITHFLNHKI